MPKITFIEFNGQEHTIEATVGQSVMQAAVGNTVPGIVAECGGACICATCHVYVDPAWQNKIEPPDQGERDIIECALDVQPNSRLSCQIKVTPALDGLVVRLPESQL